MMSGGGEGQDDRRGQLLTTGLRSSRAKSAISIVEVAIRAHAA
jgi:hypothetical protein